MQYHWITIKLVSPSSAQQDAHFPLFPKEEKGNNGCYRPRDSKTQFTSGFKKKKNNNDFPITKIKPVTQFTCLVQIIFCISRLLRKKVEGLTENLKSATLIRFFSRGIQIFIKHWNICIDRKGDYAEKLYSFDIYLQ